MKTTRNRRKLRKSRRVTGGSVRFKLPPQHTRKIRRIRRMPTPHPNNNTNNWKAFNDRIAIIDNSEIKKDEIRNALSGTEGKIIYGKFWMNGCGHCDKIKGMWNGLSSEIKKRYSTHFFNADFELSNMDEAKEVLKSTYHLKTDINVDGYPTFYIIKNGNIEYFNNGPMREAMKKWILSKNET